MFRIKTEDSESEYQQSQNEDAAVTRIIMNCDTERSFVRYCPAPDSRSLYTRETSVQTDGMSGESIELPVEVDPATYSVADQLTIQAPFGDIQGLPRITIKKSRSLGVDPEERKFGCEYCEKRFKYQRALVLHMATHTKKPRQSTETKYQCNICFKYYTQSNSLKTHMRLHTGERPYRCEYCDKRYADQANFRKHVKIHNKGTDGANQIRRGPNNRNINGENENRLESSSVVVMHNLEIQQQQMVEEEESSLDNSGEFQCTLCDEKFHYESDVPIHIKHAHSQQ